MASDDSRSEAITTEFQALSVRLADGFAAQLREVESAVESTGAGFRVLFEYSGPTRLSASHLLEAAVYNPLFTVMGWLEYTRTQERIDEIMAAYGYDDKYSRSPVAYYNNGSFLPISGVGAPLATAFSDIDIQAPQADIDADQRLFVDVSPRDDRYPVILESFATGRAIATQPLFTIAGNSGFLLYFGVRSLNASNLEANGIRLGAVVLGIYNPLMSSVMSRIIEDSLPGASDHMWWRVRDVKVDEIVFLSGEAGLPPPSPDAKPHVVNLVKYFGRDYMVECGYMDSFREFSHPSTIGSMIPVLLVLVAFVVAFVAVVGFFLRRVVVLGIAAAEAKQQAAEAEAAGSEMLLGYVNHEVRNPLNVLVASMDLVEEVVRRWCRKPTKSRSEASISAAKEAEEGVQDPGVNAAMVDGAAEHKASEEAQQLVGGAIPGAEAQQVLHDMHVMRQAALTLERQVNEMLEFQQMKSGRIQVKLARINVADMLSKLADEHRALTTVPINVTLHPPTGYDAFPNAVLADGARLLQIASNGLTNAIKFTAEGMITVALHLDTSDAHVLPMADPSLPPHLAARLRLDIIDTGEGLKGADVTKLFQPFTSAGNREVMRRRNRGSAGSRNGSSIQRYPTPEEGFKRKILHSTGLGLPICRLLASHLGGTVDLVDTGSGCRFTVQVPVGLIQDSGVATSRTPALLSRAAASPAMPRQGGTETSESDGDTLSQPDSQQASASMFRVLVMDDMPSNVRLASRLLNRLNCDVSTVFEAPFGYGKQLEAELEAAGHLQDTEPSIESHDGNDVQPAPRAPVMSSTSTSFDIVFLDVQLGKENAIDILKALLPRLYKPHPLFVAMTASSSPEDLALYESAGFAGCLSKPFRLHDFHSMLRHLSEAPQQFFCSATAEAT